jgi:DNA-binding NarL/FixJ family response regulator
VSATILIVDDHNDFRSWVHRLLQTTGFVVIGEASNGVKAIEAVEQLRPDVVLLDIQLPDIDGLQVAYRLTRQTKCPIVVLTSSRDESDYGCRLRECGARGFIPKSKLSEAVLQALLTPRA